MCVCVCVYVCVREPVYTHIDSAYKYSRGHAFTRKKLQICLAMLLKEAGSFHGPERCCGWELASCKATHCGVLRGLRINSCMLVLSGARLHSNGVRPPGPSPLLATNPGLPAPLPGTPAGPPPPPAEPPSVEREAAQSGND